MSNNKITCQCLRYDYKREKFYCTCLALFLGRNLQNTFCEFGKCVACIEENCILLPCSQSCHVLNDVNIL